MTDGVMIIFVIAFTANAIFISICTAILINCIFDVLRKIEYYFTQILNLFSLK